MKNIFLIDGCNFTDYPTGGQLSFLSQILDVFPGNYFKLVGYSTSPEEKIGIWQKKIINDKYYDFYPLYFTLKNTSKGIIPNRLKFFISLHRHRNKLFKKYDAIHLFTHAPETILALKIKTPDVKVLHFLHGVENPLENSRFKWGKLVSSIFWKMFINKLKQTDYIAAAADFNNIAEFKSRNKFSNKIDFFPTRYDDTIFKPIYLDTIKYPTFVYCGRINLVKGWELLIQSFIYYLKFFGNAQLIIIGDGEDKNKLEKIINENNISKNVTITGFLKKEEIVIWLKKSNVFLLPSFKEGWPIAMLEALGCGLPVVSANVSGADQMIRENINGFIVKTRDKIDFANAMNKALKINSPNNVSLEIASFYTQSGLKESLLGLYPKFFDQF